jgi:hypothetical protein
MAISNVSGSLALLDVMARHGAGLVQERPNKILKQQKPVRVNSSGEKEKSGTSTDKGHETEGKQGKTRTI